MLIMSKNECNIINLNEVENIFIGSDRKSIKANMASRSGCELAKYDTFEQCRFALGMLYQAALANERVFAFPSEINLEYARKHGSQFKTKKNTHGGS